MSVGLVVGLAVGLRVGLVIGDVVGTIVGLVVRLTVGEIAGDAVGEIVKIVEVVKIVVEVVGRSVGLDSKHAERRVNQRLVNQRLVNRHLPVRPEEEATDQLPHLCRDVLPVSKPVSGQQHHADMAADPGVKEEVPRRRPVPQGIVNQPPRGHTDVG